MKDKTIDHKVVCLHHWVRPENRVYVKVEGVGNCYECKTDPVNNPYCKMYTPIKVYEVEIK